MLPPGLGPSRGRYYAGMYHVPKPAYDLETMRAVAAAYRQVRQAGRLDQLAREAATAMTHIAIAEKLNGKAVEWMEQVSDEQYRS